MTQREELIKKLQTKHWSCDSTIGYDNSSEIADFIIEDRKNIEITLNKEKLANAILQEAKKEGIKDNPDSRLQCLKLSEAIIAKESELFEVKK